MFFHYFSTFVVPFSQKINMNYVVPEMKIKTNTWLSVYHWCVCVFYYSLKFHQQNSDYVVLIRSEFTLSRMLNLCFSFVIFFNLNFNWESSVCHLIFPFLNPCIWTKFSVGFFEVLAWLVVGATEFLAPVEVQKHLVAVTCLILIWESWIKRSCGETVSCGSFWIRPILLVNHFCHSLYLYSRTERVQEKWIKIVIHVLKNKQWKYSKWKFPIEWYLIDLWHNTNFQLVQHKASFHLEINPLILS